MIGVICKLKVQKERIDEFEQLIMQFKAEVDEHEPGNLEYNVFKEGHGEYYVLEKFRDREALKEHDSTKHKETISPKVGKLLDAKPEVRVLEPLSN
ncbi:putative quinol monooxygenase [uncultured Pseudodesulfovibrio sp.]|uniref:putative quinol monooxygenase n=1 Tax=uncultured Pseudodesulfovibrio sp. TaxID=2035858 RepID=UPI0029C72314|nr:putative quinol monooxygenase [uncultured Pseudodesulfovibrio sp.]